MHQIKPKRVDSAYTGPIGRYTRTLYPRNLSSEFNIDSLQIVGTSLPPETYYAPRNRYRADKLILYLQANFPSDKVFGITQKDISTTTTQQEDWGIMVLAFTPGKSCVDSTYRTFRNTQSEVHKKERLKKVVFHEFGLTLGLHHFSGKNLQCARC